MMLIRLRNNSPRFKLVLKNRLFAQPRFVLAIEVPYENLARNGETSEYNKYVPIGFSDLTDPAIYEGLQQFLDIVDEHNGTEGPQPNFRITEHGRGFVLEYKSSEQSTSNGGGRVEVNTYDVWRPVLRRHLMNRHFTKAISQINKKAESK